MSTGNSSCLLRLHAGHRDKGISVKFIHGFRFPSLHYLGDSQMDRCHRYPEENWSAPRDGESLHKVGSKLPPADFSTLTLLSGQSLGCSQCTMENVMT